MSAKAGFGTFLGSKMLSRLALTGLLLCFFSAASFAAPSRIIVLRHGEKDNVWKLCDIGQERSKALAEFYLGKGAKESFFTGGETPAGFLAVTLHTLELASPAASSWGLPITLYSVVPQRGDAKDKDAFVEQVNRRTREAVSDLMKTPAWQGKTVVMVWEHNHIANAKLAAKFPGEEVTLRQLLKLDKLPGVPADWPSSNYDYFWVIDFDKEGKPTSFRMVKQVFGTDYADVPTNDWGEPNGMRRRSGCNLKGADD